MRFASKKEIWDLIKDKTIEFDLDFIKKSFYKKYGEDVCESVQFRHKLLCYISIFRRKGLIKDVVIPNVSKRRQNFKYKIVRDNQN